MAWKRQRNEPEAPPAPRQTHEAPRSAAPQSKRESGMEQIVNIGQSVQIKGELTGKEDLTIDGIVDGRINLKDHDLTIGANGRITAEIHAKNVIVIGQVTGNITADDKVELGTTGSVQGDIRAPRVSIADGARFKGSIDMERKSPATAALPGASSGANKGGGLSTPRAQEMPRSASRVDG